MTKTEERHIARIKAMDCVICGASGPSDAHHIREGQGKSQRAGHFLVIPLCKNCHQGSNGIHGDKALFRIYKMTELKALNATLEKIFSEA